MADINILTKSYVSHTYTGTAQGAGANSIDGDFDTYQGVYLGTDAGPTATAISQHEWTVPITVDKVSFKILVRAVAHSEYECGECSAAYYIEWKNSGGVWALFAPAAATYYQNQTSSQHGGSFYTLTSESNAGQQTLTSLAQAGVYGVRARCIATSSVAGGGSYENQTAYIYEIQVLREKYEEILRVKNSTGTTTIGCNALASTHKLRIRKGATTYGIPLLATTDADASGIRIYDGSAVKALAKADT